MAATPSLRVVKEFTFRGSVRRFNNRYHFAGAPPGSSANWLALADAVTAAERHIFTAGVKIVEAVGYEAGSELPVWSHTYAIFGDAAFADFKETPGQDAALIRYSTTARSAKNHPIYLFNYYHGAGWGGGGPVDTLNVGQKAAMETYAGLWVTGFAAGGITAVRAGPNGATAVDHYIHPEITHRDFRL